MSSGRAPYNPVCGAHRARYSRRSLARRELRFRAIRREWQRGSLQSPDQDDHRGSKALVLETRCRPTPLIVQEPLRRALRLRSRQPSYAAPPATNPLDAGARRRAPSQSIARIRASGSLNTQPASNGHGPNQSGSCKRIGHHSAAVLLCQFRTTPTDWLQPPERHASKTHADAERGDGAAVR